MDKADKQNMHTATPEFYLKNFCDRNGYLYTYDKTSKGKLYERQKRRHYSNDFFTTPNIYPKGLENYFSVIEGDVRNAIIFLVEEFEKYKNDRSNMSVSKALEKLSDREKYRLQYFPTLQMYRDKYTIDQMLIHIYDMGYTEILQEEGFSDNEILHIYENHILRIENDIMEFHGEEYKYSYMFNDTGVPLITSDHPYNFFNKRNKNLLKIPETISQGGIVAPLQYVKLSNAFMMPLHRKLLMLKYHKDNPLETFAAYYLFEDNKPYLDHLNKLICIMAHKHIYFPKKMW